MWKNRKLPVVTIVILVLNLLGLIYEFAVGQNRAIYQYGMYQGAIQDGQWLRLIISAFLHFGLYHFGSNMICLVMYGFSLENRVGPLKYALIYAAAVIGSALLINFAGGNGIHAGASGAIWGLMTATLIYNLRHQLNPLYALREFWLTLFTVSAPASAGRGTSAAESPALPRRRFFAGTTARKNGDKGYMKKLGWTAWGIVGFIFAPIGMIFLMVGLFVSSMESP